jgi:hypothetical protein
LGLVKPDYLSDNAGMDQWEFIEKAATDLGIDTEAIRKWRVRGVPHQWRLAIVDAAEDRGFALDRAEFDRPPGPKYPDPGRPAGTVRPTSTDPREAA